MTFRASGTGSATSISDLVPSITGRAGGGTDGREVSIRACLTLLALVSIGSSRALMSAFSATSDVSGDITSLASLTTSALSSRPVPCSTSSPDEAIATISCFTVDASPLWIVLSVEAALAISVVVSGLKTSCAFSAGLCSITRVGVTLTGITLR